ncbi:MAG: glycosyltransferase [Candidatus Competibacteraceae bacterium]|nr:MAG: glycosyltransferase [Candidatus Competibacteraceae bacterium]
MSIRIIIIQNRPTQFDVPLYAKVNRNSVFDLIVYYTRVACSDSSAIDPETAIAPQWDHLHGLVYQARFEQSAFLMWRQIIALEPDHVVICGWYPRSHALLTLLLRLSGVHIGVRSDNTLEHTHLSGISGGLKRVVMLAWLGLFHAWHPVGTLARAYLEKLSIVQRPVFYFPYAVDIDWFAEQAASYQMQRSSLRKKLGLAEDDYVVLGVMKWAERENPLTLVDAFIKASSVARNMKLLLVGDGPLRPVVEKRLATDPKRLVAPGYAKYSELPLYYAISDLFVHPAQSEPYGVSVQEALACGLPVIVSDKVGAAADFLEPGRNGDIFPVGDVDGLAKLLIAYSYRQHDPAIREAALRKANEWSYQRTIEEWRQCLEAKL